MSFIRPCSACASQAISRLPRLVALFIILCLAACQQQSAVSEKLEDKSSARSGKANIEALSSAVLANEYASTLKAPLIETYGRNRVSLDGTWRYIVDPYLAGYRNFHNVVFEEEAVVSKWGWFTDSSVDNPQELLEYNFDKAKQITVPGDWNTQDPKLYYYEGSIWYRTRFDSPITQADIDAGKQVLLHFGGANYQTDVYLNAKKLGRHKGGFTPFQFLLGEELKQKDNSLVVRVDNMRYPEAVPTPNTDWWNYGGITRSVSLYTLPASYIEDYELTLTNRETREFEVKVKVANASKGQAVEISLPALGVAHSAAVNAEGIASLSAKAKGAGLWSPSNPRLYDLQIRSGNDVYKDRIGFRTIETLGKQILLNGEPVFFRGISIHEEYAAEGGGRTATKQNARKLLEWAKDLNANFVRLAHYPHNEHMARLADEMGLLVWAEVPVYWSIDWDNPETYKNAQSQLVKLIDRDYNRASVVIWSMANETPAGEARVRFLKGLIDTSRALDESRLVSAALLARKEYEPFKGILDDPIAEFLDIVSFNQYVGWYVNLPDAIPDAEFVIQYDKPVFISEFGGGAKFGYRGDESIRWTEEYQALLYANTVEMLEKIDGFVGTSPWILADFRSPKRILGGIQDDYNRKGLLSEKGEKKLAFDVLKNYYQKKAQTFQ